jgi:ABC-2 type transport system permease protein
MNAIKILLRREMWENRSITMAPLAFSGIYLLVTLLAVAGAITVQVNDYGVDFNEFARSLDSANTNAVIQMGLASLAVTFNMLMVFVSLFYLLDSLYADRKDKSILFWKSLPVSDAMIVGSKLLTAAILIPAVTLAIFFLTSIAGYLIAGTTLAFSGSSAVLAAGPGAILETTLTVLYGFLAQSIWYLPIFTWLLLVSAWSRKATLLWAVLPPWGIVALEAMTFHTDRFLDLLGERIIGVFPLAFRHSNDEFIWKYDGPHAQLNIEGHDGMLELINPGAFLASPGLWGGIIVAAVFFAGAVWLRRYRDDS